MNTNLTNLVFIVFSFLSLNTKASELEHIIVTGSILKVVEVPNLKTYSVELIRKQGFENLTDFLQQLTITSGSQLNSNDDSGTARSASSINLRGMGSNRTLVLVNGHRTPIYPSAKDGVDNFFNIDGYPLSMIDRIEILPSGGSAIYGSDAVGGVINIILRKNIEKGSIDLSFGDTSQGGRSKKSIALNIPIQINAFKGFSIFNASKNERLTSEQRHYADEKGPYELGYWSSFGGYLLDVSKNYHESTVTVPDNEQACQNLIGTYARWQDGNSKPCRVSHYSQRDLLPEDKSISMLTAIEYRLSKQWHYQGNVQFLKKTTNELAPPQRFGMYLFANGNTPNQLKTSMDTGDHIYRVLRSIEEYGQQASDMEDKSFSTLQSATGDFESGELELSWQYGLKKLKHSSDQIIEQALLNSITPDPNEIERWYPLNTMSDDIVNNTRGKSKQLAKAYTQQFQLIWRSEFSTFLGKANYALLADMLKESYSDTKDEKTIAREFHKYFAIQGGGSRTRYAIGSEFNVQVTPELSTNLALRYDYYDDKSNVKGAFSPDINLQYSTGNWHWTVRTGKHFRAPDLHRLYMGESQLIGNIRHGLDPNDTGKVENYQLILSGSTELAEEKGTYWDTSFSYEHQYYKLTASLWSINLNGAVYTEGSSRLLNQPELYDFTNKANDCNELTQPGFITTNTVDSSGIDSISLMCIKKAAINIASQRHKGVDLSFSGNLEQLTYSINASKMLKADYLAYEGSNRFSFIEQAFRPDFKINATVEYSPIKNLDVTLYWQYQGSATGEYNALDENSDLIDKVGKIAPYQQLNASINYELSIDSSIKFSVANMFNNEPSFYRKDDDDKNHLWPYFNRGLYSPVGRYFNFKYTRQF